MSEMVTDTENSSKEFGCREEVMFVYIRQDASSALPAGEKLMRGSDAQDRRGVGHGWSVWFRSVQASNHDMWLLPVVWCIIRKRGASAGATTGIHLEISVHLV